MYMYIDRYIRPQLPLHNNKSGSVHTHLSTPTKVALDNACYFDCEICIQWYHILSCFFSKPGSVCVLFYIYASNFV